MKGLPLAGRWRWRTHETVAAGASTRTIKTPEVARGEIRHVNRVAVYNKDSGNSIVVISLLSAGVRTELYQQTLTTQAVWYPIKLELLVFPEEVLEYAFSSCSAADDLYIREAGVTLEWADNAPATPSEIYAAGVEKITSKW